MNCQAEPGPRQPRPQATAWIVGKFSSSYRIIFGLWGFSSPGHRPRHLEPSSAWGSSKKKEGRPVDRIGQKRIIGVRGVVKLETAQSPRLLRWPVPQLPPARVRPCGNSKFFSKSILWNQIKWIYTKYMLRTILRNFIPKKVFLLFAALLGLV